MTKFLYIFFPKYIYNCINGCESRVFSKILFILLFMIIYNNAFSQFDYKEKIYSKVNELKKKVKDDTLKIEGSLKIHAGFRPYAYNDAKPFEYRINANVQLSYRGLNIPLQYNLSNGRSLYRLSGPNIAIPKLNNLGISPKYKWAKVHLGMRTMSFNKYTYDNMRFQGFGTEIQPGKFLLKYFTGKLFQSSLQDLQYSNNLNLPFARKAWGLMSGYKSKTAEYSFILFKAKDEYNNLRDSIKLQQVKPKANTAVGLLLRQQLFEKFNITYETSVSAVTYDLQSERINILTHTTVYNMLGLYEKKASSKYAYAQKLSATMDISESSQVGVNFEKITKDYKSLGSLIFDHNFEAYTVQYSSTYFKTLNISSEIGFRKDGIDQESSLSGSRVIGNISTSYSPTERIQISSSYSNFKTVERNYLQTINSIQFDSLQLALVNNNFNFSTNYILGEAKKSILTFMFSNQTSKRIQTDSLINRSNLKNHLFTTSFTSSKEKWTFNSTITFLKTTSDKNLTFGIIPNLSVTFKPKEKMDVRSNITFNYMKANNQSIKSLLFQQDFQYQIRKNQNIIFTNRLNFNTTNQIFRLIESLIELDYTLKF